MPGQNDENVKLRSVDTLFRQAMPLSTPGVGYEKIRQETLILPRGTLFSEGGVPIPCDIAYESDVEVKMRDGTAIYIDIYRPTGNDKVPSLIAWSHYGKKVNNKMRKLGGENNRMPGMNQLRASGIEKFEGPDPAYWCNNGYAIINPDIRGSFNSQGDSPFLGSQEGKDGYDLIEWIATQDWSNGKVGMAGNSWLAISQWYIAAQRPPHLSAIAPWEGFSDLYRDSLAEGGIPEIPFYEFLVSDVIGKNRVEDVIAMIKKYPLMNAYWQDKAADLNQIRIPAYVSASWSNFLHSPGTISAFRKISSKEKWLRVHNTLEWPDQYSEENREDLRRFFDRYLRGIENEWEKTPRIRMSVLDPGSTDEVGRQESEFPLARTHYRKLYIDASQGRLSYKPITQESAIRYYVDKGKATFTLQFNETVELTGYMKLRLWVEAVDSNDMDLFIAVQKLDKMGIRLGHNPFRPYMPANVLSWPKFYYYSGPSGRLRVSHRRVDPSKSTDSEPYMTHDAEELLSRGQIVPVDVPIRPSSIRWHAGEQLRLSVAGYDLNGTAFHGMPSTPTRNKGEHIIHAGGRYESFLIVPVIPQ